MTRLCVVQIFVDNYFSHPSSHFSLSIFGRFFLKRKRGRRKQWLVIHQILHIHIYRTHTYKIKSFKRMHILDTHPTMHYFKVIVVERRL